MTRRRTTHRPGDHSLRDGILATIALILFLLATGAFILALGVLHVI